MLSTTDAAVARGILDAIEEGKFKKAQKDVEKKLKKTDSDYFKALQALVKCHMGQISEKAAVLQHLEELVVAKRVITDVNTIQFYEDALELILPKPGGNWARIIGYLRWELVKGAPKDEEASRACFRACLAEQDYEHARHIANSLEKSFPGKHEYIFWNIVTMFLYSRHPGYPERERKLYGALAEGLICKLAEATVKAADSNPLPLRCIRTPQELLLMDGILKTKSDKNMDVARLEFLQNPFLGPESTIAKGEWQLWRLKLELLRKSQSSDMFQTTADLLRRARTKDESGTIVDSRFSDWLVWQLYIEAASSNSERYKDEVEAEVKAHLDPNSGVDKSWRRNAALALVKFGLNKRTLVVEYLQRCGDTNTAYVDLRRSVQDIDVSDSHLLLSTLLEAQEEGSSHQGGRTDSGQSNSLTPFNQDVTTASGIVRLVNIYKLIFLISSSMPEDRRRRSPERAKACERCSTLLTTVYCGSCLTELAWATVKSYGLAMNDDGRIKKTLQKTDRHPADDLCILSAMCLTKLSINGNSFTTEEPLENPAFYHLLQAAVLLEHAWSRSKPNSQISLMLTKIYTILGCGSLAFRAFQRLSIKQIQHASLSYYMFDGISNFHPHPFPSENASQQRTVIDELRDQQRVYKNSTKSIHNKCWNAFEHNNYNTILELEDFKNSMAYNMTAVMSVVESRKVSRLTQPNIPLMSTSCGYDILPFDVEDPQNTFTDTNDYDALPNFEKVGVDSPLTEGRMPFSDYRVHMDLFTEKFQTLLDPIADSVSMKSARLWLDQNLDSIQARITSRNDRIQHGADSEYKLEDFRFTVYHQMAAIVTTGFAEGKFPSGGLHRLSCDINELSCTFDLFDSLAPPHQGALLSLYATYEIGISILRFHAYIVQVGLPVPESFNIDEKFKSCAERLVNAVFEKSWTIKKSLDEGGWIDRVLKGVFQGNPDVDDTNSVPGTLKNVVDENFMEQWAGEVVDSWKDSVKGFAFFKPLDHAA